MGRHSNRTPFAYPEYRKVFSRSFTYVNSAAEADFIVFGFMIDLRDHVDEIVIAQRANPDVRLVVLSEEPLWDTLWSGDFLKKTNALDVNGRRLDYVALNHSTSGIFSFGSIPYFVTTRDEFFVRYSCLYKRNARMTAAQIRDVWQKAGVRAAFYAEKRVGAMYEVRFPEQDMAGLCGFRSQITEGYRGDKALRVGQGWGEQVKRQKLPDWHLDKLSALDRNCVLVSALENTHQPDYITEKMFDAYAVVGIPIYWASSRHGVNRLVDPASYVNLFDDPVEACNRRLAEFVFDDSLLDAYRATQDRLALLFSDPRSYAGERSRVVDAVTEEFARID